RAQDHEHGPRAAGERGPAFLRAVSQAKVAATRLFPIVYDEVSRVMLAQVRSAAAATSAAISRRSSASPHSRIAGTPPPPLPTGSEDQLQALRDRNAFGGTCVDLEGLQVRRQTTQSTVAGKSTGQCQAGGRQRQHEDWRMSLPKGSAWSAESVRLTIIIY